MKPQSYAGSNHGNMDVICKWGDSSGRGDGVRRRLRRRATGDARIVRRLVNRRGRSAGKAAAREGLDE